MCDFTKTLCFVKIKSKTKINIETKISLSQGSAATDWDEALCVYSTFFRYLWTQQWKTRLAIAKIITKLKVARFLGSIVYMLRFEPAHGRLKYTRIDLVSPQQNLESRILVQHFTQTSVQLVQRRRDVIIL